MAVTLLATNALATSSSSPPAITTVAQTSSTWEQTSKDTALGKALSGNLEAGVPNLATTTSSASSSSSSSSSSGSTSSSSSSANLQQALVTAGITILGLALQALEAIESPPDTINGVTYNEVYSFGLRVFSDSFSLTTASGGLGFNAGLAPTEIRVPIVVYPIGPVTLEIDGGARFQADVTGQAVPNPAIPVQDSAIGAELSAQADVAGFIEGYASFLVVRAGVGGQVDLVDGSADVNARFMFDGTPPYVGVDAWVDFLAGDFYAFVDLLDIFTLSFKRLVDYTLYSWNGYCFETQADLCSPEK